MTHPSIGEQVWSVDPLTGLGEWRWMVDTDDLVALESDRNTTRAELGNLREAFRRLAHAYNAHVDTGQHPTATELLAGSHADHDSPIVQAARGALGTLVFEATYEPVENNP